MSHQLVHILNTRLQTVSGKTQLAYWNKTQNSISLKNFPLDAEMKDALQEFFNDHPKLFYCCKTSKRLD
jgi:hypothetical protein